MSDNNIVTAWNRLNPSQETKQRILGSIQAKQTTQAPRSNKRRKRAVIGSLATLASAAAVFALVLIGNAMLSPPNQPVLPIDNPPVSPPVSNLPLPADTVSNVFTLSAVSFVQLDDGTITRHLFNMDEQTPRWQGRVDGDFFFATIGLRYDGENIRQVEFTTNSGFFAKQRLGDLTRDNAGAGFTDEYGNHHVTMLRADFEIMGGSLVFDDVIDDDLLLFWGTEVDGCNFFWPRNVEISVSVTFNDGETTEDTFMIDFENRIGVIAVARCVCDACIDEAAREERRMRHFETIPLEDLQLLAESALTPVYGRNFYEFYFEDVVLEGYEFDMPPRMASPEWMEFDENGIHRGGFSHGADSPGVFLTVFHRCDEGIITAKLYLAPFFEETAEEIIQAELELSNRMFEHFQTLPLDGLELVASGSLKLLNSASDFGYPQFIYDFAGFPPMMGSPIVTKERLVFDEHGISRDGFITGPTEADGVFLRILRRCNDGLITAHLYRAPRFGHSAAELTPLPPAIEQSRREYEHFRTFPLDGLELVTSGPLRRLDFPVGNYAGYVFDFAIDEGGLCSLQLVSPVIVKERLTFDEYGISRHGYTTWPDYVILRILRRCDDGLITAHLYRAPHFE